MILKIKKVCFVLLSCVFFLNFSCDSANSSETSGKTSADSGFELYSYGRDTSVSLKWKEPPSVSFSNIKILYKKTADSSYLEINDVSQSVKQYNVSGLENDCEYDFIFSASGSDGKIYEKSLKQTPSSFELDSYGRDTSVFLKWKEPPSVSFSNIKIQYKKTVESVYSVKNDVSQKVKQYNVSGLENDCEYDFIFSASGSDGKIYEKKLNQTPCAFEFKYFYDTALIAGNGKTYISFALEGNTQEITDFHVYRDSDQKEIGDYTVKKDILAYEELDKTQADTDQTKTFEKYYSILIEDETAYSEMTYLIRAVNAKNQESKEHSIKSQKLKLPSVSVNLGLSEANFEAFKKKEKINATLSVFSKDNPLADASLTIKGRGNSSWFNAPKKSYTIKFEKKQEFLGFDSNKSFALIANYFDKTLLRNITAYSLAKNVFTKMSWAPSAKTVHLFIDGVYQGLYSAVETVKIAKNRVNIPDISDFVSSQETTNFEDYGFILEVNDRMDEDFNFESVKGVPFSLKEPDGKDLNKDICNKIEEKTKLVEEKLYQGDFSDIDLYSFADWWIVEELAKNTDSQFYSSCYMYFDPADKKFHMGPVWDFDLGFGNNGVDVKTEGFQADEAQNGANWILELRKSEEFKNIVKERWNTCKPLIESYFSGEYEENLSNIKKDVDVNFIRWPILGKSVWKAPNDCESRTTYDSEVEYFKTWKDNRIQWLSSQFE